MKSLHHAHLRYAAANTLTFFYWFFFFLKTCWLFILHTYLQPIRKTGDRVDNRNQNKLVHSGLANESVCHFAFPFITEILTQQQRVTDLELWQPAERAGRPPL